jgi:hypothetical protein
MTMLPWISIFFSGIASICFFTAIFNGGNIERYHDFITFGWAFFALASILLIASIALG